MSDEAQRASELSDAVLEAAAATAEGHSDGELGLPAAVVTALHLMRSVGIEFVRRYHRLDVSGERSLPDEPCLLVANHGFGGIVDLNVLALFATFDALEVDREVIVLTHQVAWTLQVGRFIEALGARPAGRETALAALREGKHVLVLPGGDVDAFKSWERRDEIVFDGRVGFARIAQEAGVPIVPLVTAGAGESLVVLSDGARLARAARLDKLLRLKALPVSISLPWGLNVGAVGMLPYVPLPTKLSTAVLPAVRSADGESAEALAGRVEAAMQDRLTALTRDRRYLLG
ncbi:1-acyl-sn-glycerol-3-phosphate acyltransferase [Pseudonocardia endophytica]|uniref:Acyltransferase-like protein n=1 Tax=Pseudonocardia endophytica TaxID=401976 RepID=A0A4R1HXW2_PSEEN|nr:1-acyl-sn-glycerol-3-phosphate acyltransferase [Pseudonocardia endophytica]TCK27644.1 acyltransferase-like protein [Pseudonocardia endophytica]